MAKPMTIIAATTSKPKVVGTTSAGVIYAMYAIPANDTAVIRPIIDMMGMPAIFAFTKPGACSKISFLTYGNTTNARAGMTKETPQITVPRVNADDQPRNRNAAKPMMLITIVPRIDTEAVWNRSFTSANLVGITLSKAHANMYLVGIQK